MHHTFQNAKDSPKEKKKQQNKESFSGVIFYNLFVLIDCLSFRLIRLHNCALLHLHVKSSLYLSSQLISKNKKWTSHSLQSHCVMYKTHRIQAEQTVAGSDKKLTKYNTLEPNTEKFIKKQDCVFASKSLNSIVFTVKIASACHS